MKDNYPGVADLKSRVEAAGITVSSALENQLPSIMAGAIETFETATLRRFLADETDVVRYFDPPSDAEGTLILGTDLASFTSLKYQPLNTEEQVWVNDQDFKLYPLNAMADRKPFIYAKITKFSWPPDLSSWYKGAVKIEGRWGYWTQLHDDVWEAMLMLACADIVMLDSGRMTGGVKRYEVKDFEIDYGDGPYSTHMSYWSRNVRATISRRKKFI